MEYYCFFKKIRIEKTKNSDLQNHKCNHFMKNKITHTHYIYVPYIEKNGPAYKNAE